METTVEFRVWDYRIEIMKKKMETAIMGLYRV